VRSLGDGGGLGETPVRLGELTALLREEAKRVQ
jgi:hypothetical protein